MRRLELLLMVAATCMLTGCFQIEGIHVLHDQGERDTGSYRIGMSRDIYAKVVREDRFSKALTYLSKFSRPLTTGDGNFVYLEDKTGKASMEYFYDSYTCAPAPDNRVDCRFRFSIPKELGDRSDWTFNWDVIVQPGMKVLASNHQRTRREGERDHLLWFFDGSRASAATVDFTVRVPKAP